MQCTASELRHRQIRNETASGGTLMEVLISLVIVTMVVSSVLEVSVHSRRAATEAQNARQALNLAITWQSAHLAHADWTKGEVGYFPDPVLARWTLEPLATTQVSESGYAPDSQWLTLTVMRSNDDPGVAFCFRIDLPIASDTSSSADPPEGNP